MRKWTLRTFLPELGVAYIAGEEMRDEKGATFGILFSHPRDETAVFQCSIERALEISRWPYKTQRQFNLKIIVDDRSGQFPCPHCQNVVLEIVVEGKAVDYLHGLPYCDPYRNEGDKALGK